MFGTYEMKLEHNYYFVPMKYGSFANDLKVRSYKNSFGYHK